MKNILNHSIAGILFFSLLIVACQAPQDEQSLEGKQALLKSKKATLQTLKAEIDALNNEIKDLSPVKDKKQQLVTTITAEQKDFVKYLDIQSSIQADDIINVTSEVPGRILQLNAQEGEYIKKGQMIAKIDMESADKQIAEIEVSLDLAQTIYERQERLWNQNIGSELQYLQAKNSVERLEKTLETIRFQQSKANIYAPISGYVDREVLKQGDLASPGMPILQILNTYNVKTVAELPENYLGKVKRGDRVDIYIPALDKELPAKISLIGRTINPSNRTFKVEAAMTNSSGLLKPNLLVQMKIKEMELKDAILLPTYMVQQEISGKDYVYRVMKEGKIAKAEKVYVETGETNNNGIVIKSGINAQDLIIDEGARRVANGEELLIINPENK